MGRRAWGAVVAVSAVAAGVVGYVVTRPDPVPAVSGTMSVTVAGRGSPDGDRFLADVGRSAQGHVSGPAVEVRVAWSAPSRPGGDCSVQALVLPDAFDLRQAMQSAVYGNPHASAAARTLEYGQIEVGSAAASGAPVFLGADGRVSQVLRAAGLPDQSMLTGTSAGPGSGTLVSVYRPATDLPVEPARFRGWILMQCGDRVGPLSALTVTGAPATRPDGGAGTVHAEFVPAATWPAIDPQGSAGSPAPTDRVVGRSAGTRAILFRLRLPADRHPERCARQIQFTHPAFPDWTLVSAGPVAPVNGLPTVTVSDFGLQVNDPDAAYVTAVAAVPSDATGDPAGVRVSVRQACGVHSDHTELTPS